MTVARKRDAGGAGKETHRTTNQGVYMVRKVLDLDLRRRKKAKAVCVCFPREKVENDSS